MTPTRILTRRRLATSGTQLAPAPARRRRRTRGFVQVASAATSRRLRLDALGHAYLGGGVLLVGLLFYLGIAAQITQTRTTSPDSRTSRASSSRSRTSSDIRR